MKNKLDSHTHYIADHSAYGGEISRFDFDGHLTMASMAGRIARDFSFDRQCRKNCEQRNLTRN